MKGILAFAMASMSLLLACALAPRAAYSHAQATTTVQFDREIVRILDNHCVMCHMEKGPAFPLVTYEQTYAARWKIRQSVLDRHMPPWAAVPGYGDFANDNALTQREIDFLVSWAESYGPRNNGEVYTAVAASSSSKPVQARTDFDGWSLGKPDVVVPIAANKIERVIIDPKLKSDRWLRGLEYKPGDRAALREASFTIQESGQWLGSWTPWHGVVGLPDTLAFRLPAGSHIVADIHSAKEPAVDQGSLALYFSDRPSARALSNLILEPRTTASGKRVGTMKLDADANILTLEPAIAAGLQSIQVTARAPGGAPQVLLFARGIPVDWPTPYVYRTPVSLPKGTELSVIEHTTSDAVLPVRFSVYQGPPLAASAPKAQPTLSTRRYELTGTVKSVDAVNGRLIVQHGDIPGLMGAMTMAYTLVPREDLKNVAPGDEIHADVVVSDTGAHLEKIEVTRHSR